MVNPPIDLLGFFRTEWATRFTDSCVVKRETGTSFNDTTGVSTPTYSTNYIGVCLIRPLSPSEAQFGQELLEVRGYTVFLPYSEIDQQPGDLVDIGSATDGFLVGKQFVVRNVNGDTYITNRALICEEVVGALNEITGTGGASQGSQVGDGSG